MVWRRARKMFRLDRLAYLEATYRTSAADRNFGVWRDAPREPAAASVASYAPHIAAQTERRDTILCGPLFEAFPAWHWGIQPTGDCTRWMQQHLLDVLAGSLFKAGKIGRPHYQAAGESLYGFAKCELVGRYRYSGPGCTGRALAEAAAKFGWLERRLYERGSNRIDLSEETNLSISWGNNGLGVPDWLEPLAAERKAADALQLTSAVEMGQTIQAGYPCGYCGYTTWGLRRGSDGVANRFDRGWHAMTAVGVRWDAHGDPAAFWIANTGHGDHCEGPVGPLPVPSIYAECGSWIPAERIAAVIAAGDCYTTSWIDGMPILTVPNLGGEEFLG